LRRINHVGEYFDVEGPINIPRSPQGRPVLVQAGSSESGMRFGTAVADMIYTAQPDLDKAVEFYRKTKKMAAEWGRDPELVKVMPGIVPVVADTRSEANEIADELSSYLDVEQGRDQIAHDLGLDL